MSQYGPPGGPYPDQPHEPWPPREPAHQYGVPSDPWGTGQAETWGGAPVSIPPDGATGYGSPAGHPDPRYPGYADPGYADPAFADPSYGPGHQFSPAPAPGYGAGYGPDAGGPYAAAGHQAPATGPAAPPWPPAARQRLSVPMIALVASLAVVVCGALAAAYVVFGRQSDNTSRADAPAAAAGPTRTPTPTPTGGVSPSPGVSTDARFVTIGQCVRNDGSAAEPRMTIVPCGQKTYQVLARYDGATNGEPDAKSKCAKVSGYTNWYFFNSELDTLDFVLCLRLR